MVSARQIEESTFRFRATLVFVFMWGLSLFMPALSIRFDAGAETGILVGYQVLVSGWMGLAYLQLGWLANPLLAILLCGWASGRMKARTLRVIAAVLVATSLWTVDLALRPAVHRHEGFGLGYWWWMTNNLATAGLVLFTVRNHEDAS